MISDFFSLNIYFHGYLEASKQEQNSKIASLRNTFWTDQTNQKARNEQNSFWSLMLLMFSSPNLTTCVFSQNPLFQTPPYNGGNLSRAGRIQHSKLLHRDQQGSFPTLSFKSLCSLVRTSAGPDNPLQVTDQPWSIPTQSRTPQPQPRSQPSGMGGLSQDAQWYIQIRTYWRSLNIIH